jgi:hypothetical protein
VCVCVQTVNSGAVVSYAAPAVTGMSGFIQSQQGTAGGAVFTLSGNQPLSLSNLRFLLLPAHWCPRVWRSGTNFGVPTSTAPYTSLGYTMGVTYGGPSGKPSRICSTSRSELHEFIFVDWPFRTVGTLYAATSCTVPSHTRIVCTSAEGMGAGLM